VSHWRRFISGISLIVGLCGCGRTLAPDRYYTPPPPGTDESRHVLLDKPEPPLYDNFHLDLLSSKQSLVPELEDAQTSGAPPQQPVTEVSRPSRELAESTGAVAPATNPTTAASTQSIRENVAPGFAGRGGAGQTIGAVVVRVNNQPIYADRVLAAVAPVLMAEARQRDADSFLKFATTEIGNAVRELVKSELIFGQAQQVLEPSEKEIADRMTMIWRQQQVTKAGGSLEQARTMAAAEGKTFDEMVQDQ
jgi:hypothetical protein